MSTITNYDRYHETQIHSISKTTSTQKNAPAPAKKATPQQTPQQGGGGPASTSKLPKLAPGPAPTQSARYAIFFIQVSVECFV